MMKSIVWILTINAFFAFFSQNAHAEPSALLIECEEKTSVINIVPPIKDSIKTFANGSVRLWHLDTNGEPACCSQHLAITFTEPEPEQGELICVQLSMDKIDGFYNLSMKEIKSDFDANKGLSLAIPVKFYDNEQDYKINLKIDPSMHSVLIETIETIDTIGIID